MARLGLAQPVRDSVEQTFERWDGKGVPKGAKEEEILVTSRLVTLADVVEVFHRAGGTDAAIAVARQRRGTQFDPHVVDVFTGQAAALFAGLDEASSWDAVIAAEPALGMHLTDAEFDAALEAVADFADGNRLTPSAIRGVWPTWRGRPPVSGAGRPARDAGPPGRAGS